jgi:ATP-dependent protease ClpP protease subunit
MIQQAMLYQTITHRNEDSVETIVVDQVLSGGFGSAMEIRALDWQEREVSDRVYGPLITKTRRVKPEDLDNEWLKQGWLDAAKDHGLIQTVGRSDTAKSGKTWTAEVVCANIKLSDIKVTH